MATASPPSSAPSSPPLSRAAQVGYGLVAALYLLSFPYHPGMRSPNELSRLYMSRALVDHGSLSINEVLQVQGGVGDLSCTVTVDVDGKDVLWPCVGKALPGPVKAGPRYYSSKAPLLSVLGAPVYWALKQVKEPVGELGQVFFSRLFITVLPALLLLVLLRRFLVAFVEPALADLVVITYAAGTMALPYGLAFMSHQLTAVLGFACFFVAWRIVRGELGAPAWALAGLLAGLVVTCEYTGALTVLSIAAYVVAALWKDKARLGRAVGLVVAGGALPLGALLAYHQACWGSPFESAYKFLNDAAYQSWHVGGFLGIKTPDLRALVLSYFSPLRGLFALSPFLLLAFFGVRALREKDRPLFVLAATLFALNTYFTASFTYDSWGWTVGPRHLTPWLPFLMLPVALALSGARARKDPALFAAGLGVCFSSVVATNLATFVSYVPDDVSTSVFGLAVPLLTEGVWPVSWLVALGLTNPTSGALLVLLAAGVAGWLVWRARELEAAPLFLGVALLAHLAVLKLATSNDAHDVQARKFLTSVWLAKNGERFSLF